MAKRGKYEKKYNESSSKSLSIPTLITHSADSYFAILWKGITTLNTSYLAFFNKKAQSIKIGLFNESGLSTLRICNFRTVYKLWHSPALFLSRFRRHTTMETEHIIRRTNQLFFDVTDMFNTGLNIFFRILQFTRLRNL